MNLYVRWIVNWNTRIFCSWFINTFLFQAKYKKHPNRRKCYHFIYVPFLNSLLLHSSYYFYTVYLIGLLLVRVHPYSDGSECQYIIVIHRSVSLYICIKCGYSLRIISHGTIFLFVFFHLHLLVPSSSYHHSHSKVFCLGSFTVKDSDLRPIIRTLGLTVWVWFRNSLLC